jgi:uncharacterized membrane protein
MKIALIAIGVILIWFILGFIAFLIEAKEENYTSFNQEARREFKFCLANGLLSLVVMLTVVIYNWFCNKFMNELLFKINEEKKDKTKDKDYV